MLLVHPSVPVKNVKELIDLAKSKPGQINYASSGNGTSNHLAMELFKHMANVNLVHVPYRGAAPTMNDLIAGHVPVMFDSMPAVIGQVREGRIRALAVGSPTRAKLLPELPTISESGIAGCASPVWYGLVAPAGTPAPILDQLIKQTKAVLELPDVVSRITELGVEPGIVFGADFGTFLKNETARWTKVIEISGARID